MEPEQNDHFFQGNIDDAANQDGAQSETASTSQEDLSWDAPEFVYYEKNSSWYVVLSAITFIVAVGIYFLTKSIVATAVMLIAGFSTGVYASRKPQQITYGVSNKGFSVGIKKYTYGQFRSYVITQEGDFHSAIFMPMKRFGLTAAIYYLPENQQKITDMLSNTLPVERQKLGSLDRFIRSIRF